MKRATAIRYLLFVLLAFGGFALDVYSKAVVFGDLGVDKASDWTVNIGSWCTFRLFTSFNRGALWGMFPGLTWVFVVLSFLAGACVIYWMLFKGAVQSWWLSVALGLVLAGTMGNLFDRLALHGHIGVDGPIHAVRDFLLFTFGDYHWPVFNFADVFLVTGAIMLGLYTFKAEPEAVPSLPGKLEQKARRGEHPSVIAAQSSTVPSSLSD